MSKITLTDLVNLQNETTAVNAINDNSAVLVTAFDNTLSRDGTSPNQMENNLDMNSFRVLNLPAPVNTAEPLRLADLTNFNGGGVISNIPAGGTTNQVLTKTSNVDYQYNWENAVVAGSIANSSLATVPALSLKGNSTTSVANPSDIVVNSLPSKSTPTGSDLVFLLDQAAGGAFKTAAVSSIGTSSGISGIDSQTGSFTTGNGIDSVGKVIEMTAARRTNPTITILSGSGTYTPAANILWFKVTSVSGGGGAGGGNNAGSAGANGGGTTFSGTGVSHSCTAGSGANGLSGGGPGGVASGGNLINASGNAGGGSTFCTSTNDAHGGQGGGSFLAGGGRGGYGASAGGINGASNGAGGGGGGVGSTINATSGGGGGGGAAAISIVSAPSGSYTYSVGGGGIGSAGGTNGGTGGNGAGGTIIIEEYYNS